MELERLKKQLNDREPTLMDAAGRYAVLVPLVRRADGLYLLYEVRARSLSSQPGEVCFPGGRMEPGETPEDCALRETREELGIDPACVQVLGDLDFIAHRSNFIMYPVLGLVEEAAVERMTPNPPEVDEVFLVPLNHLRTTAPEEYVYELKPQMEENFPFERLGIAKDYNWRVAKERGPFWQWENHTIWGLTGKITRHLIAVLNELNY